MGAKIIPYSAQLFAHENEWGQSTECKNQTLALILINLQYNCQNLSGMALAWGKGCNLFGVHWG